MVEDEGRFQREQEAKAARRKQATDAAESFKSHESTAGSVFKVSGPREASQAWFAWPCYRQCRAGDHPPVLPAARQCRNKSTRLRRGRPQCGRLP